MFPHLSDKDYRDPLFTFSWGDGTYGFYSISIPFWLELLTMLLLETFLASFTALILFSLVVKPKRYDTTLSHLLGFGILLPFWIATPVYMIRLFEIRNMLFKFMFGVVVPTISIFRSTEALFGFAPNYATKSAMEFVMYFSSVFTFSRNKEGELIEYPLSNTMKHLKYFTGYIVITGALQSLMSPFPDLAVFGAPGGRTEWFASERLLTWQLYANNLLYAALFQMYLTLYSEGLTLFWCVSFGYQIDPVMKNPLLESRSPSDFWGRRWNLIVHKALKGGVFKPVRKYYSRSVAVVAVFVASGAFHEWLVHILFAPLEYQLDDNGSGACSQCFSPTYGGALVFFLWQAMLVAAERMVGRTELIQSLAKNLPLPLRTAMIISLGLPLAHFFAEPYVRSNFFRHAQPGLPIILAIA